MLTRSICLKKIARANRAFASTTVVEPFSAPKLAPQTPQPAQIRQSTLANGIKVISRSSQSPVVNVTFSIHAGSQKEEANEQGSALNLAANAFVGTTNASGVKLTRTLENLGAKFGATADREKINVHLAVLNDKVGEAFATVAEAISFPPKEHFISESAEFVAAHYDNLAHCSDLKINELIHEAAFGERSGLGASRYALGFSKVDAATVINFRNKHFTSGNLVVAANGLTHEALTSLVENNFKGLPTGQTSAQASAFVSGEVRVKSDLDGQTAVAVAFPVKAFAGVNQVVKEHFDANVAKLNLPKGTVKSFLSEHSTGAIFGFRVFASAEAVNQVLSSVVGQLKTLGADSQGAQAAEAKATLVNFLKIEGQNSSSSLVDLLAGDKTQVEDLRTLSAAQVSQAVSDFLKVAPAVAILGQTKTAPSQVDIVNLLK